MHKHKDPLKNILDHVIDRLEDDAKGRGEELKELWEDCEDDAEIKLYQKTLKNFLNDLRAIQRGKAHVLHHD